MNPIQYCTLTACQYFIKHLHLNRLQSTDYVLQVRPHCRGIREYCRICRFDILVSDILLDLRANSVYFLPQEITCFYLRLGVAVDHEFRDLDNTWLQTVKNR